MDPSENSLRQRVNRAASLSDHDTIDPIVPKDTTTNNDNEIEEEDNTSRTISILDILRLLFLLALTSSALSYYVTTSDSLIWGYPRPWWTKGAEVRAYLSGPLLLTPSELSRHDGSDPTLPLYLALNGTIYDVSASAHMYGPGGGYAFFAGRDATRAFVTGCFREDLTGDMRGVEEMFLPVEDGDAFEEVKEEEREREVAEAKEKVDKAVAGWKAFYDGSDKYFAVGRIVREDDGDEMGPVRPLCEAARKQRPKRSKLRERKEKKGKKI